MLVFQTGVLRHFDLEYLPPQGAQTPFGRISKNVLDHLLTLCLHLCEIIRFDALPGYII